MAWTVSGTALEMAEGDFGINLPFTISGTTLSASDTLRFTIKDKVNGTTILEKEYSPSNNEVNLSLTEAESGLFSVGKYCYNLDWYRDGVFMCNVIKVGLFRVGDKA